MSRIAAITILFFFIAGCSDTKSLPGGFDLEKWEDGITFYVTGPDGKNQDGGGAIEGTALRLAWNSDLIAVERYATFRGDKDGWMIIDVKTKKVSGPVSNEVFMELQNKYQLRVMTAMEAWEKL
jgi:hypothetical protein